MEEWKEYRLGDILSIKSGFSYKGKYIGKGDSLLLGMGCVSFKEKILMSGARPYSGPYDDRYKVHSGDIVLATRQQSDNLPILAMPAMVPDSLEGKNIVIGTNLYKVEITDCTFSNVFIYWLLKTKQYVNYIAGVKTSTTVSMVTKKNVEDFTFLAPTNPKEREEIVSIISSLDDKIAVNRRICENLEAQAQALFKHWFIDFAPFKKGNFVESELGMIPEGWRIVTLNEACLKVTDGSHYSPKDDPLGNIPMLSVKDMQHNGFDYSSCKKISEEEFKKMKANDCVPLKNDILVAKDGSYLKEIFLCIKEIKQAILSSIAIFRSNNTIIYPEILLQILRLPKIRKDVGDNYVSGTALPRIVLKDFKKYRFIIAPIEVQDKIIGTFRTIDALIYKKEQESLRLSTLRDTLLPKLMSGEIKV